MFAPSGIRGLEEVVSGLPKNGLILVAGNPGTGKTIFSAGFIYSGITKYGEKGVYASIAEDRETFYQEMSELGYDFESLEKKGMFRFLNLITLLEEGTSTIIGEILNAVESLEAKRLVIDPFSAISQAFKDPREVRVFLHTFLSKVVKRLGCTTILIGEIPFGKETIGYGFEEFVADAVIILKNLRFEDKLIREIRILKMRGAEVRNPDLCFTLHGGFRVMPPFRYSAFKAVKKLEPPSDPPNAYSTGIPDLDEAIGGYPKGSTVMLEVDSKVQSQEYRLIVGSVIADFVLKGRPCLCIPSAGTTWKEIPENLKNWHKIGEEESSQLIRIFTLKERGDKNTPSYVIPWSPRDLEKSYEFFLRIEEELVKKHGKQALKMIGIDSIIHYFGEDGAMSLANLEAARQKYTGGLALWLAKPIYPEVVSRIKPLSDVHLKFTRKHGCLLLYGVKPRTPLYAVEMDTSKGYVLPKLTPMV